jgi:putative ABC transport system substrate-binding protein
MGARRLGSTCSIIVILSAALSVLGPLRSAATVGIFLVPLAARAQQGTKIPRLGYISPGDIPRLDNAFLQGLQDQGYIVPGEIPRYDDALWRSLVKRGYFAGQKIRIEIRATGEHFERAQELTAELVRLDVDVIYAIPDLLVKAAQQAVQNANRAIPIVFGPDIDPVGSGLVDSLARPSRNMTGLAWAEHEFDAKRLQILKETFPRISRVAYLTNPTWYPQYVLKAKAEMETAARALGVRLETIEINTPKDLKGVFTEITRRRTEAIVVSVSPLFFTERQRIVDFVAKRRLPATYGDAVFVEDGGLMFYGAPLAERKRQAAALVAKILRGTNPADIPVEQPTTFKLLINLKTARALGLTIPKEVLFRADQVIE